MQNAFVADLQGFQQFYAARIAGSTEPLTPEAILDEWREQHPSPETEEEDLQAVEEALLAYDRGERGRPIEEFLAELEVKHSLPQSR